MRHFPSLDWFKEAARSIEEDEEFRRHGRWLKARIAIRVDQACWVLHFDRGSILEVQEGPAPHDFLVSGSADQWACLFEHGWGLVRLYRTGVLDIQGDAVVLMQNWKAFFFFAESLKRHFARANCMEDGQ